MRWKIATAILGVLFVATNGSLLYALIDRGVTLSYRDAVIYELGNKLKATSELCNLAVRGKSKTEAIKLLKQMFPGEKPFEKDGAVNTTWLSLKLGPKGMVEEVVFDETVLEWE